MTMQRQSTSLAWIGIHFVPLLIVPLATHALRAVAGIDAAAAITHFLIIAWVSISEMLLMRLVLPAARQWGWRSAFGLSAAVIAGLVVMSTVDLRGYDALATVSGLAAAGLALGLVQGPAQPLGSMRWVGVSLTGWLLAAVVFRSVIAGLAGFSIGGFFPWGLAYNAGHNELLWFSVGLACHGIATAWNVRALNHPDYMMESEHGLHSRREARE